MANENSESNSLLTIIVLILIAIIIVLILRWQGVLTGAETDRGNETNITDDTKDDLTFIEDDNY